MKNKQGNSFEFYLSSLWLLKVPVYYPLVFPRREYNIVATLEKVRQNGPGNTRGDGVWEGGGRWDVDASTCEEQTPDKNRRNAFHVCLNFVPCVHSRLNLEERLTKRDVPQAHQGLSKGKQIVIGCESVPNVHRRHIKTHSPRKRSSRWMIKKLPIKTRRRPMN